MPRYTNVVEGVLHEQFADDTETERIAELTAQGWTRDDGDPGDMSNFSTGPGGRFDMSPLDPREMQPRFADARRVVRPNQPEPPLTVETVRHVDPTTGRTVNMEQFTGDLSAQTGGPVTVEFVLHGQAVYMRFGDMKTALDWLMTLTGGIEAPTQILIQNETPQG